ncbi:MAG: ATP-dependent helicase, partial [Gammaproteobacteria bacterium]|nr:ATP-dependent helicase [Gammaproteobacteria bacterium]
FVSREEERALSNIERLIGDRIKRIKMPGYEVGSRDSILEGIAKNARPARTNKASETNVAQTKVGRKKSVTAKGASRKRNS